MNAFSRQYRKQNLFFAVWEEIRLSPSNVGPVFLKASTSPAFKPDWQNKRGNPQSRSL
jgi:hypothetical protein